MPFGDITEIKQKAYQSGSSVIYKCANFYKLDGEQKITCRDGEWEKEPVCRGMVILVFMESFFDFKIDPGTVYIILLII